MLSGIELTKNFFFSYTWPIWRTVQATLASATPDSPWDSMFVWNDYLTRCVTHHRSQCGSQGGLVGRRVASSEKVKMAGLPIDLRGPRLWHLNCIVLTCLH